jgi:hypothetical protein
MWVTCFAGDAICFQFSLARSAIIAFEPYVVRTGSFQFSLARSVNVAKDGTPEPYVSWFCGYCPFLRRCAEVGIG